MTAEGTRAGVDVVTLGETMALVAGTGSGPFAVGSPARISFGGAETNVAIGLARLEHSAAWIGHLGDDPLGTLVRDGLRAEGVDTGAIRFDTDVPTGLMLREHRTADRVRVSYYRKALAGSRIGPGDVDPGLVASARVLHVSGITPALSESARAALRRALEVARENGVRVCLDLNYRSALWSRSDAGAELAALVPLADLIFAGPEEAALVVAEGSPESMAAELVQQGPGEAVIKLGKDGALGYSAGATRQVGALPVTTHDPVGAGDAFVAGYLSGLLDELDIDERMARGAVCGAFAVSVAGDWEGAPRRYELTMFAGQDNVTR